MKSTTIRFADPVYAGLVQASRATGLPINSIVTVACLEWLRASGRPPAPAPVSDPAGLRSRALGMLSRQLPVARPLSSWRADPLTALTASAQDALAQAQAAAEERHEPWIGTRHLLQGLAAVPEGRAAWALERLGVDVSGLGSAAPAEEPETAPAGTPPPTRQLRRVVRRAREEAEREGSAQAGTGHLLLGLLLDRDSPVAEALEAAGAAEAALREALATAPPEA